MQTLLDRLIQEYLRRYSSYPALQRLPKEEFEALLKSLREATADNLDVVTTAFAEAVGKWERYDEEGIAYHHLQTKRAVIQKLGLTREEMDTMLPFFAGLRAALRIGDKVTWTKRVGSGGGFSFSTRYGKIVELGTNVCTVQMRNGRKTRIPYRELRGEKEETELNESWRKLTESMMPPGEKEAEPNPLPQDARVTVRITQ